MTFPLYDPSGKQLVAGKKDGRLTQYKPDLKEAKTVAAPPGNPVTYLSVLWVSTYQFLVAFKDLSDQDSRPGLCLVQSSKAGDTTYVNYDDICYRCVSPFPTFFIAFDCHNCFLYA